MEGILDISVVSNFSGEVLMAKSHSCPRWMGKLEGELDINLLLQENLDGGLDESGWIGASHQALLFGGELDIKLLCDGRILTIGLNNFEGGGA